MALENIQMVSVSSSNIKAVGFDPLTRVLLVEFHSGGRYIYHGPTEEEYNQLLAAPSATGYLNANIKPKYGYEKL